MNSVVLIVVFLFVSGCVLTSAHSAAKQAPTEETPAKEVPTEEAPTTEAPDVTAPNCTILEDGLHGDPEAACSQFFFACVGSTAILQKCPPHLRFDVASSRCLAPTHVGACGGSTTSLPEDQKTTTTTLRPPPEGKGEPDFPCGGETGNFADPIVSCSPFFYSCTGARFGTLRKCPGETFFDPLVRTCDFFDSVTECSGKVRTTQEPSQEEGGTTVFIPESKRTHNGNEFDCSSKLPGNYPEPDIACVNHFFVCDAALQVKKQRCPRLTFYDTELNQCLLWKDVPNCSGNPRTSPATLEPVTTPKPPFDCSRLDDGNYPVPNLACPRFFYQCAHGNAHRTPCPVNLRYHVELDQCVMALEVPSCTGGRKG